MVSIKNVYVALCLFVIPVFFYEHVNGQNIEQVQSELNKINQFYDSSVYLGFNVTYHFDTDTVLNKSKHVSLDGEYAMYGTKSFYRVGSIEYLHNDSFSIAAYNDEKFLVGGRVSQQRGASSVLPVKSLMDSMMQGYFSHYNTQLHTTIIDEDTLRQILFVKNIEDTIGIYDHFSITYDSISHAIIQIKYSFKQPIDLNEEDSLSNPEGLQWNVCFKIVFSNYHFSNVIPDLFSESRLINEEYPDKWVASGKYLGYTLYWSESGLAKQVIQ